MNAAHLVTIMELTIPMAPGSGEQRELQDRGTAWAESPTPQGSVNTDCLPWAISWLDSLGSALPMSSGPVNLRAPDVHQPQPLQGRPVPSPTSESKGRPAAWLGTSVFTVGKPPV